MEETIKTFKLDAPEGYDYYYEYQEVTDPDTGKTVFSVNNLAECPEDAIIGRDLFDAHDWLKAVEYEVSFPAYLSFSNANGECLAFPSQTYDDKLVVFYQVKEWCDTAEDALIACGVMEEKK